MQEITFLCEIHKKMPNELKFMRQYAKISALKLSITIPIRDCGMQGLDFVNWKNIRFAVEEPHLFRFLFQSGYAVENSLLEMIDSEELLPVLSAMQKAMDMSMKQTKEVFLTIAMFAHGYASIIANNSLEYDEDIVALHLKRAYRGAILAVKEETK